MREIRRILWIMGFALIVSVCNLHLLFGAAPSLLVFDLDQVAHGEWWRIITHPFVHVSWYHLVLDYTAVLVLWNELRLLPLLHKFMAAASCAAASLIFSLLTTEALTKYGLCGFSGTAHGLTLFLGVYWLTEARLFRKSERRLRVVSGVLLVCGSLGKSIVEAATGSVMFLNLHRGNLGIPIVESHLGGIIGGLAAALIWAARQKLVDRHVELVDNVKNNGNTSRSRLGTSSSFSKVQT